MKISTTTTLASLAALSAASKESRTFAVLRFLGDGFLTEGPVDPIVNPGELSTHYHGVMGGNKFGPSTKGDDLLSSTCTTAMIKNDKSNYWVPSLFFQDPKNGTFQKVPVYYMNVYYFFEPTDDEVKPFPVGLKMITGDSKKRTPPKSGALNLDPNNGPINAVQWTCPRTSYDPPSYPVGSDGSAAGMVDPNNQGSGAGLPLYHCDTFASPLRQDMHFPSCYNPAAGLDDYENNMAWPTTTNWKQNCPEGWIHVPHIFFEVYWNTPLFNDYWTPDGKSQPFVLSTGDATGYSSHGDFLAGWDQYTLQTIIDTCDAGDIGMNMCPNIPGGLNDVTDCKIPTALGEFIQPGEILQELPIVGSKVSHFGQTSDETSAPSQAAPHAHAKPASGAAGAAAGAAHADKPAAGAAAPAAGGAKAVADNGVKTVTDIVTVTVTTTVEPTATQAWRRHAHEHAARHI